jgi:hypothetical protein
VGSTIPLYPLTYILTLGNHPTGDFLTWYWGTPWGAGQMNLASDTTPGLRAADIAYFSLLFTRGTINFETFFVDAVRFSA